VKAQLSLPAFEQRFRTWLLEDYHTRVHEETKCQPKARWEAGGFVPRTPKSLEQLDLLLLTVAKTRRVSRMGSVSKDIATSSRRWQAMSKKRS